MGVRLIETARTNSLLLQRMSIHYSRPRGFVGRSICYAIYYDSDYYGHIVAGSATKHLPGRNEFFGITVANLNNIINNVFYNVSKVNGSYPARNFTVAVLKLFMERARLDWERKYGDQVMGFETLIELPRTGELYKRAGWKYVGTTKGYTCKRISGKSSDGWTGRRVWDTTNLRPKDVYAFKFSKGAI